jgi:Histidine kinase
MIVSVLSLQSRTASPEAAAQLTVAANRIASFARVNRRLHVLDHQASVEFKRYLLQLCEDLSGLLFEGKPRSRSRLWRLIYPLRSLSRSHLSCVKTPGGITAPGILGSGVMRRAKNAKICLPLGITTKSDFVFTHGVIPG